jgi:hypothetical protein
MNFTFADPKEWWLEILPSTQSSAWQQSQTHSNPSSRWNAYLNQICLETLLAWFKAEYALEANGWLNFQAFSSVWEVVTGSAITLAGKRLVLIPTEVIDDSEFEIPQEWIDIPGWAGDYYLIAQVIPEDNQVRVLGYTTHQGIKASASYDPVDRTYCLDAEVLTQNMSKLWVTMQSCPTEQTRSAIAPLVEPTAAQADQLSQRLGNPSVIFPRLAIPFGLWGALLENNDWRQQLYRQRIGATGTVARLSDWLQNQFETAWQAVDIILSSQQVANAWSSRSTNQLTHQFQNPMFAINRVKVLDFEMETGIEQIALLVGISLVSQTEANIGIQICPTRGQHCLPNDVQVRLFDQSGVEVGQAGALVTEIIQLQFSGNKGEQFSLEITCGNQSIIEQFEI